jgi:signal transduction histidine kinase
MHFMRVNSSPRMSGAARKRATPSASSYSQRERAAIETQAPEQLAAVLDALDVPICIADFQTGRLLFANDPFKACFGADAVDIADAESGFAVAPSARFTEATLVNAAGQPSGVQVGEFEHVGAQRSYLVRARAVRWKPDQLARLHALVDITQRVESERFKRSQQEKLLLTSRWMSVGELTSTLAHELNQPLGAIGNFVQGAIRRLRAGDADIEEIVGALEHARLQSDHAAKVVSRMREFVRTREPRREPVAIADLVGTIVRLIEPEAQKHSVALRLNLPADLPQALADRVMIEQVVLNLVKNAIEALSETLPARREVSICARVDTDNRLEVAVEDSGQGLSAEAQEQIFSPFFTTKPDGMGIGLSICRSIVEYHDGGLFFAVTAHGGARFWFTLPQA